MKSYTLNLSRTSTQMLFVILYPILAMLFMFGALVVFDDFITSQNLIWPTVISFMVLMLVSSALIINRYINLKSDIKFDRETLSISLPKRNMFYRFNKVVCSWDNVKNVSVNFDKRLQRKYILLELKEPGGKYLLMAVKKADDAKIDAIWAEMNDFVDSYNSGNAHPVKITKRGFYAGPWMRLLAYAGICMLIVFTIIAIYSAAFRTTENILKLLALTIFLIPFLINFFASHKREREENKHS